MRKLLLPSSCSRTQPCSQTFTACYTSARTLPPRAAQPSGSCCQMWSERPFLAAFAAAPPSGGEILCLTSLLLPRSCPGASAPLPALPSWGWGGTATSGCARPSAPTPPEAPAGGAEGRSLQPFLGNAEENVARARGSSGGAQRHPGCPPAPSLLQGRSSGLCTGQASPGQVSAPVPSAAHSPAPGASPTHSPCSDPTWAPPGWELRLAKPSRARRRAGPSAGAPKP